jgi:hypothetical protein
MAMPARATHVSGARLRMTLTNIEPDARDGAVTTPLAR